MHHGLPKRCVHVRSEVVLLDRTVQYYFMSECKEWNVTAMFLSCTHLVSGNSCSHVFVLLIVCKVFIVLIAPNLLTYQEVVMYWQHFVTNVVSKIITKEIFYQKFSFLNKIFYQCIYCIFQMLVLNGAMYTCC